MKSDRNVSTFSYLAGMIAGLRRNAYILLSTLLLISAGGIPAASAEAPQQICQRLIDSAELMTVDKEYAESFALLTKAETLAKNEGLDYLLADIHVKAGHNYYDMFDYGEALAQFMEAYQIAIQTSNIPAEIRILTKISFLYKDQKYYDRAEEFLQKSYDLAIKNQDPMLIGWVAVNFVDFLIVSERYDEAGRYLDIAYGALKDRDPLGLLIADINKVELLYNTKTTPLPNGSHMRRFHRSKSMAIRVFWSISTDIWQISGWKSTTTKRRSDSLPKRSPTIRISKNEFGSIRRSSASTIAVRISTKRSDTTIRCCSPRRISTNNAKRRISCSARSSSNC